LRLATSLVLVVLLAPSPTLAAGPAAPGPGRHARPAAASQIDFFQSIDANNLDMALSNVGSYAFAEISGSAGLIYPKGTPSAVVFAAGIWLGAIVDGAPRVTVADYAFEYQPGSAVGAMPEPPNNPWLHVYKLHRVYADPGERDLVLADYNTFAVSRGAPIVNVLPDGSLSIRGDQMCWAVYNDLDASVHDSPSGATNPLQVEVAQTTWAYDRPGPFGNSVFIEFKIINRGPILLTDMHLGLWVDPDLGGFTDDLVGCEPTRSLGYCYNENNTDLEYDTTPPAVGVDLLQGPFSTALGHRLPMTAFTGFTNGTDPVSANDSFNLMHGLDRSGNPIHDPSSNVTTFMFTGDPVAATGWLDPAGNDKRFLLSSGPFTMPGGSVQTVVLVVLVSQGTDRLDSVARLRADDDLVQTAFDTGTLGSLGAPVPTAGPLALDRVYPNPARNDLGLALVLPAAGEASVELLDLAGRRVLERSLGTLSAGPHAVSLAGATGALSPGVYFLRLTHANASVTRRVALSR
jgi:hypothetical protein